MTLDLGQSEDLAVFLALVPDWQELAAGLDLTTEQDRQAYRERLQDTLDERVAAKAAEARALNSLPGG